jgi:hypothetical protein
MRQLIVFVILSLALLRSGEAKAQAPYCKLSGGVFKETDPARAQYRVYLEESESFADVLVFQATNFLFADKPGCWFFTESRAQANLFILFVEERSQADFSIFFTETESFAGCQNQPR